MTTLEICLIIVGLILIAIPVIITLAIYYEHKRQNDDFYANFQNLTYLNARYWDTSKSLYPTQIELAFILAVKNLKLLWPEELIVKKLTGICIQIMPTDSWESNGQKVAGLTHLDLGVVSVGPKMQALCHELIHILEDRLEGKVDYNHVGWEGKKFNACHKYVEELNG